MNKDELTKLEMTGWPEGKKSGWLKSRAASPEWVEARQKGLVNVHPVDLVGERAKLQKGQTWLTNEYNRMVKDGLHGQKGVDTEQYEEFTRQWDRWDALEKDHRLHGGEGCIWDRPTCNEKDDVINKCKACVTSSYEPASVQSVLEI